MPYTGDEDIVLDFDIWLDGPLTPERVREEVARMMDEVVEEMADQRRRVAAAATPFIPRQEPPPPDDPVSFPIWQHTPYDPPGSGGQDTPPAWRPRLYAPPSQPAEVVQPRPWQVGGHSFYFEEPGDVEEVLLRTKLPPPAVQPTLVTPPSDRSIALYARNNDGIPDIFNYDRDASAGYATNNADDTFSINVGMNIGAETDCANFASQVLRVGGFELTTNWWYESSGNYIQDKSVEWVWADSLFHYLTDGNRIVSMSHEISINKGDLVFYDYNSNGEQDHVAVIIDFGTAQDGTQIPIVVEHGAWRARDSNQKWTNEIAEGSPVYIGQQHPFHTTEDWVTPIEAQITIVHIPDRFALTATNPIRP